MREVLSKCEEASAAIAGDNGRGQGQAGRRKYIAHRPLVVHKVMGKSAHPPGMPIIAVAASKGTAGSKGGQELGEGKV